MARLFIWPLLIVVAAAVYLVGNDRIPLWDRDEPRNAQAARQMLTSGDWVVPRFLDKVRTAKPPFTAWCQASAMWAFGQNSFSARLPSAIAMTATLILLAVVLTRTIHGDRAFWTVLILATSGIVIAWCARNSLTDAVLLLWITITQLCLCAALRGRLSWKIAFIWAIAVGLAGLTKGPVVLGVQGMTILIWWLGRLARVFPKPWAREAPARRPSHAVWMIPAGILIVAAIVLPWAILVERRSPGFLWATTRHDVLQRITEPLEQHYGPPGYYLLVLWGIYFPWSVLLPLTFVNAWRHRDEPIIQFALAAVIGPWLMLECVQTKLPHYLLPIFPPLTFLTADAIVRCLRGEHPDLTARGTRGAIAVWGLIVIGLALAPWFATARGMGGSMHVAAAMAVIGVVYATAVFAMFQFRRPQAALATMGLGMFAIMLALFGLFLPSVEPLKLSIRIADILRPYGDSLDVQMIQYKEPSLAFYQGGSIREQPKNDFFMNHPFEQWPEWTVIRDDVWGRMPHEVKDRLEVVGSARGLDVADRGRTWTVWVVRKRPRA
jgi:4-amino-4-deoxy-L-arabinose transferase-like glycosyltransferase